MSAPILVTGGTGNIGSALVGLLREAGAPVRVLTRDPGRAAATLGPGVELAHGDLARPEALASAFVGADHAFFLGHAGPDLAATAGGFAAAAKAAGVRHVVAVSSGTIEMEPPTQIGRWHAAMEDAITAAGVATTFLRPDNFASNALRWAPMIRARGTVFAARVDGESVPIDPHDIGAVASVALTTPGHEGKVYTLSGPTVMSTRDQVGVIAAALGKPVNVVDVPPERARAGMIDGGLPPEMADAILELMGHSPPRPTTAVRDVTGREPRSFAAWVRDHLAAFQ